MYVSAAVLAGGLAASVLLAPQLLSARPALLQAVQSWPLYVVVVGLWAAKALLTLVSQVGGPAPDSPFRWRVACHGVPSPRSPRLCSDIVWRRPLGLRPRWRRPRCPW